ncbi:MAG: hypothetical protein GX751_07840 [Desulfuromonadaceae bacterium]|jgi:hypothetical protein|nr:hypothetical protein [Desulfuromonadaceae bacterium]
MRRLGRFILWGLVLVLVLLAIDLSLIYLAADAPYVSEPRRFYLDFRTRLMMLMFPVKDPVAEQIAIRGEKASVPKDSLVNDSEFRYVFVDQGGEIRFAATLQEIPPAYRSEAKRLAR